MNTLRDCFHRRPHYITLGKDVEANIALIPARSGSKRLPDKNIRLLNGFPLIAYTIDAAQKSNLFSEIIVSTDSSEIASIARNFGVSVPGLRPKELAGDSSTDFEWVEHALREFVTTPLNQVAKVAILRPTSPLRKSSSIISALNKLNSCSWADSVRAMEPTTKHPGKMWTLDKDNHALPFLDQANQVIPTYNRPTQSLQPLWVQNASLEIVKLPSLLRSRKISGDKVLGIELHPLEGFDLNTILDWDFLEYILAKNPEILPTLKK